MKWNLRYFKPSKLITYPTFFLTKLAGINHKFVPIISLLKKFFGDLGTFLVLSLFRTWFYKIRKKKRRKLNAPFEQVCMKYFYTKNQVNLSSLNCYSCFVSYKFVCHHFGFVKFVNNPTLALSLDNSSSMTFNSFKEFPKIAMSSANLKLDMISSPILIIFGPVSSLASWTLILSKLWRV